jgi:hypothetical protein
MSLLYCAVLQGYLDKGNIDTRRKISPLLYLFFEIMLLILTNNKLKKALSVRA